ncbi:ABC transporter ATP-binding protein [Rubellicoccus peritrichatus]|uniref:ATP-binding cassette domain-containing protein n=1 Tax=Rubellicoccus peritrichatus TaxID=3080537 RepID=A0AAQ3L5J4_9BACT|nr:ATP-binding cassette domain-containing protein [Puniceicoccus sp. CR14]WOO39276.1 ATP-binding cassette domain-containing protein [Puniceicoccus sp. CR14]
MSPEENKPPILSVEGLGVYRGKTCMLKGVDWTVEAGEHWAILGANGSGKTSLLAAITAYLMPSEGEVRILGDSYGETDWHEVRQRIGIVSSVIAQRVPNDEAAIATVMSGETAQLGYWTRKRSSNEDKALRCLELMGVDDLAHRLWGVLSQGERQKVFIARALMADPALLILDEPCAGLDPVARERFLLSLRQMISQTPELGLILVTHHVEEIFPEISHVLVLSEGEVLASGPKAKVMKSEILGKAFGAKVRITKNRKGIWQLSTGCNGQSLL